MRYKVIKGFSMPAEVWARWVVYRTAHPEISFSGLLCRFLTEYMDQQSAPLPVIPPVRKNSRGRKPQTDERAA